VAALHLVSGRFNSGVLLLPLALLHECRHRARFVVSI
jgi:hypothetical protein